MWGEDVNQHTECSVRFRIHLPQNNNTEIKGHTLQNMEQLSSIMFTLSQLIKKNSLGDVIMSHLGLNT